MEKSLHQTPIALIGYEDTLRQPAILRDSPLDGGTFCGGTVQSPPLALVAGNFLRVAGDIFTRSHGDSIRY
jgi:hypothetical protein